MRQEKVKDKAGKAKVRKGSKDAKQSLYSRDIPDIRPFINRIICGDTLGILGNLPSESIDLIITSPPYNFGHVYASGSS